MTTTTYTVPTNPEYYGEEATEELAERVAERIADAIREAHPDINVAVRYDVPPFETYDPTPERRDLDLEVAAIWERELVAGLNEEEEETS